MSAAMSARSISRVACAVDGESMRDGAYTARGPSGPSGCACAPWWLSCTKTRAPASWTASVIRCDRGDRLGAEGVLEPADRAGGVHEVVARDEQPAPAPRSAHEVGGLAVGLDAVGVLLGVRGLHECDSAR